MSGLTGYLEDKNQLPNTLKQAFIDVADMLRVCKLIAQAEMGNDDPEIVLEVYRLVTKQHDHILYDLAVKKAQEQNNNSDDCDPDDYDPDADF